jgi:hypothetical protein
MLFEVLLKLPQFSSPSPNGHLLSVEVNAN